MSIWRFSTCAGLATVAATVLLTAPGRAATYTWDGGGANSNWSSAANWVGDVAPTPAEDLELVLPASVSNYSPVVGVNNPWTLNTLRIQHNSYSLSGNTLRFAGDAPQLVIGAPGDGHGYGFYTPIELAGDLTIVMQQNYNFYMDGPCSGSGSLTIVGGGGSRLGHVRKPFLHTGATIVRGSLNVGGTDGRIGSSSRIDLFRPFNASSFLSALAGGSGDAANRIADTIPVNIYGGTLTNHNTSETVGDVTLRDGYGGIAGNAGTLHLTRLNRLRGGAAAVSVNYAAGARVFVDNADSGGKTMTQHLVGGGGGAGATNISIVPFLRGGSYSLVTYSDANGFRVLDTATEFGTSIAGAGTTDNVRLTASETLAANAEINALVIHNSATVTVAGAGHTLKINSGAIHLVGQASRPHSISVSTLDLAGREAVITCHREGGYSDSNTISSALTNATGLTLAVNEANSNPGNLTLSGVSNYTGPTTVLRGTVRLSGVDRLPTGTWVRIGEQGTLQIANSQTITGLEGIGTLTGNLAINNASDFEFAGSMAGSGSLSKAGAGTQTFSGASTYTGTTAVSGGVLRVDGTHTGGGTYTISGTGTLAGSGTITAGVVSSGGTFAPGSSAGTLSLGSLTLDSASTLNFELGAPGVIGGGVNDLVQVAGALVLDGTLNVTPLAGFGLEPGKGYGVYTLFTYGSLTDNGLTLNLSSLPLGYDYRLYTGGGQVLLMVPEPASFALLALGGLLLRRRRHAAAAR
jgi:autotransporter-associated beta strand protein